MLLSGKTALVLGVANRWSIAYAISAAYVREGARLILTYQSERQKATVEDLGAELKASKVLGVVLNAVKEAPLSGGYYGYDGYDSKEE